MLDLSAEASLLSLCPYWDQATLLSSAMTAFCEARIASHCHSPQTTYSSKSTCCTISAQKPAIYVVVYEPYITALDRWNYQLVMKLSANFTSRLTTRMFWGIGCLHSLSSTSHSSVLRQHPRRKMVPYRVGWTITQSIITGKCVLS